MSHYIFLTAEGSTSQPIVNGIETYIENLQVIGISEGMNSDEAFSSLVNENIYLTETSFNEIFAYELSKDFEREMTYHHLA